MKKYERTNLATKRHAGVLPQNFFDGYEGGQSEVCFVALLSSF